MTKPDKIVKDYTILGHKYIVVKYKCQRCNRYFRNLNMHDKTSRCGRVGAGKLAYADKEWIEKLGLDKAIKKCKP